MSTSRFSYWGTRAKAVEQIDCLRRVWASQLIVTVCSCADDPGRDIFGLANIIIILIMIIIIIAMNDNSY